MSASDTRAVNDPMLERLQKRYEAAPGMGTDPYRGVPAFR
jgi:hypothetical protein